MRLRHEDNGLALYYGPNLVFTTPNTADTRTPMVVYCCGKKAGGRARMQPVQAGRVVVR